MPCSARSIVRRQRSETGRSTGCAAAASSAEVHGLAVKAKPSPSTLNPVPPRVSSTAVTPEREPFSCGRTYSVCSAAGPSTSQRPRRCACPVSG